MGEQAERLSDTGPNLLVPELARHFPLPPRELGRWRFVHATLCLPVSGFPQTRQEATPGARSDAEANEGAFSASNMVCESSLGVWLLASPAWLDVWKGSRYAPSVIC